MAIKTAEKEINGKLVKIVKLGAIDGIKMSQQLGKVAFPILTSLENVSVDMASVASAAIIHLDEIDLGAITVKLFDGATVDGFPIKVDEYFAGNYGEWVSFVAFALEENFSSYFTQGGLFAQV